MHEQQTPGFPVEVSIITKYNNCQCGPGPYQNITLSSFLTFIHTYAVLPACHASM